MAWSRTDIANRALGILGVKDAITDVDTDTSTEAKAIRAVLDLAIDSLASECDWPYQRRIEEMSLVDGSSTDAYSEDWQYAYRYSTYWVKFLDILEDGSNGRQQSEVGKIPYRIVADASGRLILTDLEEANAEVAILPEEGLYPAKYVEALATLVAMMAGPRLQGSTKVAVDLRATYEDMVSKAKVFAANESEHDFPVDSPGVRARRGGAGYGRGGAWQAFPNGYDL